MPELARIALSVVPVFLFLAALFALDSFKLVSAAALGRALGAGAMVAVACFLVARWLGGPVGIGPATYSRWVAPVVEEAGKALFIGYLIRAKKIGFMVDGAILGFAVGAGFATVENLHYLSAVTDANLLLWGVRGFGTAVLHGGATAIVGITSKLLADLRNDDRVTVFLPGLGIAALTHALFNQFVLSPVAFTVVLVAAFPPIVFAVFTRSERLLRQWLEIGLGSDVEVLAMLRSGQLDETPIGRYLRTLRDRFPGEVLADMLCYLQIWVELSIRAKGRLLLQEAGFQPAPDPVVGDRFAELTYLEGTIGATGRLALAPFLRRGAHEIWGLEMLRKTSAR